MIPLTGTPKPILIKACLNGPRVKSEHPRVPVTADEIATDARIAVDAGAGALHFHPRGADGRETLDPGPCGEAVTRVRELCPGISLGLSTAKWIVGNPAERLDAVRSWKVLPDFASVNFNERGYSSLCRLLLELGIGFEVGVWSRADAVRLVKSKLDGSCTRILVEMTEKDPGRAVNLTNEIEAYLERSGVAAPRLHHGYGLTAWSVMNNAIRTGKDIRVGLEDTLVLPDGTRSKGNGELIESAVRLAKRFGRDTTNSVS